MPFRELSRLASKRTAPMRSHHLDGKERLPRYPVFRHYRAAPPLAIT
jgi:hypothetical protein